ncbi:MAG: NADH-quinone oxidoreductase subunit K [Deltaproteobacteria bacterium]|nr:NADH-quinone oxidoreductase subunit K [Deltaproteobacteria bacterium]
MLPVVTVAVFLLVTAGVYLLLHRSLLRVALGLTCLTHGVNFLVLSAGRWGSAAPIVTDGVGAANIADPVPQAFVLTAIVIAMAFTLYLLAGMAVQTRWGGIPKLVPAAEDDAALPAESILAELEGRGEET